MDIKPINEEMDKLMDLNHEHNKITLNIVKFGFKENKD